MQGRRVAVTGIGLITPIGIGRKVFWKSALEGKSGIGKIVGIDTSGFASRIAGQVVDFEPADYIPRSKARHMSRQAQMALAAAKMALEDSRFVVSEENCERVGVFMGSSSNAMEIIEKQAQRLVNRGSRSVNPLGVGLSHPGAAAGNISVELGLFGETFTVATGCSSSSNAMGLALRSVRSGSCDVAITGGVDTPITPLLLSGFGNAHYLSQKNDDPEKASRPFDRLRDGYVLSEGAGILVFEEYQSALDRDAPIYAEIAGYSNTSDAYSTMRVEPNGAFAVKALRKALKDAQVPDDSVDYFSAHGSSSVASDCRETKVIKEVFNGHASKMQISSIKSMIGHPVGASGAIQAASCVLAIKDKSIPPTINYEEKDPECDLDYVPNEARESCVRVAVSNCLGMGGNNSCLVFKEYDSSK